MSSRACHRSIRPAEGSGFRPLRRGGQLVGVGYGESEQPTFWIQLPINGQPASMGNGVHIAFRAATRAQVDAFFLAALEHGMPESAGIALGFDRLVMLAAGVEHIEDILWAPVASA